jgi:hypothetical protein
MRIRSNMARVVAAGVAGVIGVASLTVVAGAVVGHPARSESRAASVAKVELVTSTEATTTTATTEPTEVTTTEGTTIAPTTSTSEAHEAEAATGGKDGVEADEGTDDQGTEPGDDATEHGTEHATTVPEDPSRPMTYRVGDAGTVTFTRVGNVLTITSIAPKSGWTAGQPTGDAHEWHVLFTNGDKTMRLTIVVNAGKVTIRVEEMHAGSTPPTTHLEHATSTTAPQPRPEPTTGPTTSTTKA